MVRSVGAIHRLSHPRLGRFTTAYDAILIVGNKLYSTRYAARYVAIAQGRAEIGLLSLTPYPNRIAANTRILRIA